MGKPRVNVFVEDLCLLKHVGLDSMCFIYHFADHPRYSPLTNTLFKLMEDSRLKASSSVISLIETLVAPEKAGQPLVVYEYEKSFQGLPNLTIIPVDWPQAKLAAKLRAIYTGLRTPDAIQIASCLIAGASAFLTNDKRLKQVKETKILMLDDYL